MSKVSSNFVQFFSCGLIHHLLAQEKTDIKTNYHKIGYTIGPRLLEIYGIQQNNNISDYLHSIKNMLSNLYLSRRTVTMTDDREYYIITESNPLLSRSGIKQPNPNNMIAGIIEGCLDANLFGCSVVVNDASSDENPNQIYYLVKNRKGNKF